MANADHLRERRRRFCAFVAVISSDCVFSLMSTPHVSGSIHEGLGLPV